MVKYETDDTWKTFTTERQKYSNMLWKAKLESWVKKISECGSNVKKLYNLVTTITGSENENLMPLSPLHQDIAEEFVTSLPKLRKFMII